MKGIEGKVVIVTGATSGLGKEIALQFAREKAKLVICGRREKEGNETLALVRSLGAEAEFVNCDISVPEQVEYLVQTAVRSYGRLDFAINNAGFAGVMKPITEYPIDVWDNVVNVNLKGTFVCMKYELEAMLKNQSGVIVNVSSAIGLRGKENISPYSATKHGIIGLTKSAAFEYGRFGIRINALCPGGIRTEMDDLFYKNSPDPEALRKERMKSYALGRMAEASEVARVATWLCSEDSSFVTGASIPVDGGKTAR
ncbi:short-chain dehydrogenase [Leptospira kobayashii]|uniref:Short-chain dehydrogenase n=1 Tax=Leptospira kobayashii TaxID=1917830 RepID=A0ABN6KB94_9LEPT|nr:glucose 1-dehydrogenase [Leptospira kobayashii]BDA77806.1 short-chain dehydrogenase [Leptospira kobayashii]